MWNCRLKGFAKTPLASIGHYMLMRPNMAERAVHDRQILARLIWLCACVRWWPHHRFGVMCGTLLYKPAFKWFSPWVLSTAKNLKLRANTVNLAFKLGSLCGEFSCHNIYFARSKLKLHSMWNCRLILTSESEATKFCLQKMLCAKSKATQLSCGCSYLLIN